MKPLAERVSHSPLATRHSPLIPEPRTPNPEPSSLSTLHSPLSTFVFILKFSICILQFLSLFPNPTHFFTTKSTKLTKKLFLFLRPPASGLQSQVSSLRSQASLRVLRVLVVNFIVLFIWV